MLEVSPSFRRRARLAAWVRQALAWPARVAQARRTLTRLGQMTERELGDIGLLRSDLADATALPRGQDPGRRLAEARAARARFAPRRLESAAPGVFAIFDDPAGDSPRHRGHGSGEDGDGTELVGI